MMPCLVAYLPVLAPAHYYSIYCSTRADRPCSTFREEGEVFPGVEKREERGYEAGETEASATEQGVISGDGCRVARRLADDLESVGVGYKSSLSAERGRTVYLLWCE